MSKDKSKDGKKQIEVVDESTQTSSSQSTGIRMSPFGITIVCLLALIGLGVYVWNELQTVQRNQHQTQLQSLKQNNDLLNQINQVRGQLRSEQMKIKEQAAELKQSVLELRKLAGRERQGWILAEVEYLLLIANHKVKLQADTVTAIRALGDADIRLSRLADPQMLSARKLIAEEIAKLKAVSVPDVNGITLKLDALSTQIKNLGLNTPNPRKLKKVLLSKKNKDKKSKQKETWQDTMVDVWAEVKTLVVIRKRDMPVASMLSPEQEKALRQVLEFKIQAARIAVLKKHERRFKSALNVSILWINEHFDTQDLEVKKFKQTIAQLQAENLSPVLPSISGSLDEVRFQLNKKSGIKKPSIKKSNIDKKLKPSDSKEKLKEARVKEAKVKDAKLKDAMYLKKMKPDATGSPL